jgi:hypothetical protein
MVSGRNRLCCEFAEIKLQVHGSFLNNKKINTVNDYGIY